MKQLSALNIARLRTEESFGYLKQVETETANLPGEEPAAALTAAITTFTTNVDAFDDALKASATNPATATATAADDARDAAWRGANNYAAAMCAYSRNNARRCSTNTATPRSWRRPRKAACCTTSCKTLRHCPSPKSTFLSGWKT